MLWPCGQAVGLTRCCGVWRISEYQVTEVSCDHVVHAGCVVWSDPKIREKDGPRGDAVHAHATREVH
jgi:hypothetical protein